MSFEHVTKPYAGPASASAPFAGSAQVSASGAATVEGVLSRRLFAYGIDFVVIMILTVLLALVISIVGFITFGLGWALFALLPGTAILYSAVTVGGSAQATLGMRLLGLRAVDAQTGGPVGMLAAALHAVLFYLAASTFLLLCIDLVIGASRDDRRLGHDLLANVLLLRR
jgi:uncharacterized RDD family membrane protein YckC